MRDSRGVLKGAWLILGALGLVALNNAYANQPVQLTLLHTNDLHSHFRKEPTPLGLGGLARIKTMVDRIRTQSPETLLVDGGDWSEGHIYYTLQAGAAILRMMDQVGYDVAVVGNHDWINGPDTLLDAYRASNARLELVAANLDLKRYSRAEEFKTAIPSYVIREVQGVRVAFVGLVTDEKIYDRFFEPVKIKDPEDIAADLARKLKKKGLADVVIAISHNSISRNEKILKKASDLDLVIGAHDHVKLVEPVVVKRRGRPDAWIVESGSWGQYLGKVQLTLRSLAEASALGLGTLQLDHYELIQMDHTIEESAPILASIADMERQIENQFGEPMFSDHVADSTMHVDRQGAENLMGNLVTDSYLQSVEADLAMTQVNYISGEVYPGQLRSADLWNALPQTYNPVTAKTWTLKTFEMSGRVLKRALSLMFGFSSVGRFNLADSGPISVSGMTVVYNPILTSFHSPAFRPLGWEPGEAFLSEQADILGGVLEEVRIGEEPLDSRKRYRIAASDGVLLAIEFINSRVRGVLPISNVVDTGIEEWRVLSSYLGRLGTLRPEQVPVGNRIRSKPADLGLFQHDITILSPRYEGGVMRGSVRVRIRNSGATPSREGTQVSLRYDQNLTDTTHHPSYADLAPAKPLPSLGPQETIEIQWDDVALPGRDGIYSVNVNVDVERAELVRSNNQVTRWWRSSN